MKYSNVLRFLLSPHANPLRLASLANAERCLRGGTTWQSSAAENHSSPMTDPSSSHCAKGMYSKLGAPTRRSRELKTKYLFERSEFILLRLARRKVGQVVNEALTFCFVLGQAKMKIQDKHIRARQYKTNSVSNIKYSETSLHMTKVEPQKLYPNTCVYTRCLNGIESELSFSLQLLTSIFSSSQCDKGMYSKLGVPARRSGELKTKYLFEADRQVYFVATARRIAGQVVNEALTFFVSFFVSRQKMKIKGEACDSQIKIIHPHLRLHTPLLGGAGGGVSALRHCEEVTTWQSSAAKKNEIQYLQNI